MTGQHMLFTRLQSLVHICLKKTGVSILHHDPVMYVNEGYKDQEQLADDLVFIANSNKIQVIFHASSNTHRCKIPTTFESIDIIEKNVFGK